MAMVYSDTIDKLTEGKKNLSYYGIYHEFDSKTIFKKYLTCLKNPTNYIIPLAILISYIIFPKYHHLIPFVIFFSIVAYAHAIDTAHKKK